MICPEVTLCSRQVIELPRTNLPPGFVCAVNQSWWSGQWQSWSTRCAAPCPQSSGWTWRQRRGTLACNPTPRTRNSAARTASHAATTACWTTSLSATPRPLSSVSAAWLFYHFWGFCSHHSTRLARLLCSVRHRGPCQMSVLVVSSISANSFLGISSTPVLPQQCIRDSGHSAKSAGGRLQLNMRTPQTQQAKTTILVSHQSSAGLRTKTSSRVHNKWNMLEFVLRIAHYLKQNWNIYQSWHLLHKKEAICMYM